MENKIIKSEKLTDIFNDAEIIGEINSEENVLIFRSFLSEKNSIIDEGSIVLETEGFDTAEEAKEKALALMNFNSMSKPGERTIFFIKLNGEICNIKIIDPDASIDKSNIKFEVIEGSGNEYFIESIPLLEEAITEDNQKLIEENDNVVGFLHNGFYYFTTFNNHDNLEYILSRTFDEVEWVKVDGTVMDVKLKRNTKSPSGYNVSYHPKIK